VGVLNSIKFQLLILKTPMKFSKKAGASSSYLILFLLFLVAVIIFYASRSLFDLNDIKNLLIESPSRGFWTVFYALGDVWSLLLAYLFFTRSLGFLTKYYGRKK